MTGYTYDLVEKKYDFKTFALKCARAFGACITMRDDSWDAEIPEKFEPSSYHTEELEKAKKELARLKKMKSRAQKVYGLKRKNEAIRSMKQCIRKEMSENRILNNMLSEVNAWEPPTPEHVRFKEFMVQQLTDSRHDLSYSQKLLAGYEKRTPTSYYRDAVASAKRDIEYHTEHGQKDVDNAANRTEWIQALRKSLATA